MRLRDLLDTSMLARDIEDGFVRIACDDDDPSYLVLCYTPHAQFSRHWDDVTRSCRGLALKLDEERWVLQEGTVISRGIPKFFTMASADSTDGENLIMTLEDDDEDVVQLRGITVELDTQVHVADKLDGAMCVGYVRDGRLRVHTKGSFCSDEAKIANRILDSRYDSALMAQRMLSEHEGLSPIFEVITPMFPHIVDYGSTEDLFLLGWVEIETGIWHPVEKDDPFAHEFSLGMPQTIFDGTFADMLELPDRKGKEGVVVTVSSNPQRMIKVKYEEFLKMQRLRSAIRKRDVSATAERMLIITKDWYKSVSETFDPTKVLRPQKLEMLGLDSTINLPEHIIDANLMAALPIAVAAKPDFDNAMTTVILAWAYANGNRIMRMSKDEAFVRATLDHAPEDMRQTVFATKRIYIDAEPSTVDQCRDEIATVCARYAVKRHAF